MQRVLAFMKHPLSFFLPSSLKLGSNVAFVERTYMATLQGGSRLRSLSVAQSSTVEKEIEPCRWENRMLSMAQSKALDDTTLHGVGQNVPWNGTTCSMEHKPPFHGTFQCRVLSIATFTVLPLQFLFSRLAHEAS